VNLQTEPAALTTAITAAVIATVNVLGLSLKWDTETVTSINIAAAGWIAVLGFWIRSKVVPVKPLQDYADAVARRTPEFP
jgi:hypothetical protein